MDIEYSNIRSSRPEILIRFLNNNDAKNICDYLKDKEIVRHTLQIPYPYHIKDAKQFIKESTKARKSKTAYVFGIELKETQKIIGVVSLSKIDKKNKNCELGFWLGKKYWRKGVTSAAVKMILDYAFNKLKMHRVYAQVFASNTASLRVLEKNNFLLEGILFEMLWRNNQWHNMFLYGILRNDFK